MKAASENMRWRYRAGWSKSVGIVRGLLILAVKQLLTGLDESGEVWEEKAEKLVRVVRF